ncbi:sugar ABC transporter substrate-binding protein [Clostridia bacterium]|nr:sugar ABC transporter substrate-binding protein [Clostridia bacterium]
MKKIFTALIALALLTACAPTTGTNNGNQDDALQVGVILPTRELPRWTQEEPYLDKALKEKGISHKIIFAQGSPFAEKEYAHDFISKGVKVLLICANDGVAAASEIEDAKKAGITTIAYDRPIMHTDALDYIVGFDTNAVGEAQGNYLISQAEGTGNPLYLYSGPASDENSFLFFEGAWKVLQPKIADGTFIIQNSQAAQALSSVNELTRDNLTMIISQISTNWEYGLARTKAEADLLNPYSSKATVYILAGNDITARAISDVFAGKVEKYYITGQDADKDSIQYILDGKQSMTVLKDLRKLSQLATDAAVSALKGETVATTSTTDTGASKPIPTIELPVITITKDNIQQEIFDSGYYDPKDFSK